MNRSKPLGKGLSALIQKPAVREQETATEAASRGDQVLKLPIETVSRNRNQPRREFPEDELNDLAQSIREHGILQPVIVFEDGGLYTLIAGERRWRAAQIAGLKHLPAILRERPDDAELMRLAVLENIQREDLQPLDLAQAYRSLIDEHAMTQEELAISLGQSRSVIANVLRLLKLPPVIRLSLKEAKISFGHAKVLMGLAAEEEQIQLWQQCVKRSLSVRQLEDLVRRLKEGGGKRAALVKPFDLLQAEEGLAGALGAKVQISPNRNRGQIRIEYHTRDELERLLELLGQIDDGA
jgi:ParB family chromosome partitioning protein